MKDFDTLRSQREQRERTFKIAGREFRFRPALPARSYVVYLEVLERMGRGEFSESTLDAMNATMIELLEVDDRAAWGELVANNIDNPISFDDINLIIQHCLEVQSARPTNPLSTSGATDESGTTKLTAVSDSPEVPAQQIST